MGITADGVGGRGGCPAGASSSAPRASSIVSSQGKRENWVGNQGVGAVYVGKG